MNPRRAALLVLCALLCVPALALAQDDAPVIDVVEVSGPIDRPIERYALERIEAAERDGVALVAFQIDSLGGLKVWDDAAALPRLVERVRDARVPVAVWVGPRAARLAGVGYWLGVAADVFAIGPSGRIGPVLQADGTAARPAGLEALAEAAGRAVPAAGAELSANESLDAGAVDLVVPSMQELLTRIDGMTVETADGRVTLAIPGDEVTVRFHQPGPIRRMLHAFANPSLVYLMLIAGALLICFELFQPGFGVAGVTGGLLLAAVAYGLTVLPARWPGLLALCVGCVLMTLDVARNGLGVPSALGTAALAGGSVWLFPGGFAAVRLHGWLIGVVVVSAVIFFVPVMTVVRRARVPIEPTVKRELVGEAGDVRSMLNPEGFVWVSGAVWRARSEDGTRMRVGEPVVVSAVEGSLLIVRADTTA